MRWFRYLLTLLVPVVLLVPIQGTAHPQGAEAPWREGGWVGAFSVPRPTLPGHEAQLESAGPITTDIRVRIHRIKDPVAFLQKTLSSEEGAQVVAGVRGGSDPLDILREAFLWGGRRTFVTVHRAATRALRDTAKQAERLQQARTPSASPRDGEALPLEGREDMSLVTELVPHVTEELTGGKEGEEDDTGERGHLSRITLPAQPAGLYLLEVLRGSEAAYIPWLVTDLALLAEQDGSTLRVQGVSALDGSSRSGLQGQVFENRKGRDLGFSAEGLAETAATPGLRRFVMARSGDSLALLAIEGQSFARVQQRLYAFTERPLYRPGQEVFVKAILRKVDDMENKVFSGVRSLPYRVLDPEDTEVAKGDAGLLNAETGTYGTTIQLPAAGRLGLFRVVFEGPQGPGQAEFKVEQFVKPSFSVKVSTPNSKVGLGDGLPFSIEARYFYGAAVRNAKADWFLYRVAPKRSDYLYYYDEDDSPAPELMESGQVDLDEHGQGELDTLKATEEGVWRLVVKVADASGQRNSGQAQVRASAGDMVLMIGSDRQVALPGVPFQVTARAVDLEGQELKGIPIQLRATRIKASRVAWWADPHELKPGETVAKAQGPQANLSVPEGGVYLLVAEARDRGGRSIQAQRLMTVAAEGTPLPATPDLRASADKRDYQVGDTARILVQLPRPRLTLRWSLEHEHLGEGHARVVQGTTALVEVPVTAAMQPNVWAVFEIVAEGRRQLVEVPIRVPRKDRRLEVHVQPDQERYQPGQKMKVNVEVKDWQGHPVSADLAVGVVDEAIYALSSELNPDPVRFFNPTRRHAVLRAGSTDWSFYDLLRRQRPVWSLKKTRRGEFKADDADKVRQNFKDTAYWSPMIAVGGSGRASAELTLPDNLTAWRATATALTSDTRIGVGRASRPASKPLQVSLTLPRTLSVGEEGRVIALVRNLSGKPLNGQIHLDVANGKLKGRPEADFSLQDQGEYRFTLPLETAAIGSMTVTARVEGGSLKDAERRNFPVLDPLIPVSVSGSVVLKGGAQQVQIPVPPKAKGEAALVVTPIGSLEHLLAPSLPYLIGYPYGCVEQTLSSFVPNLMVADLVKQRLMPPLDWPQLSDLDHNIRNGVFRVYGYQLPNGGWGWWAPKDFGVDANPHTTGYAIQSFAAMKQMGYAVDENVYRRGRQAALQTFQDAARQADERGTRPVDPQATGLLDPAADASFLLLSLAQTGEPVKGILDSTADKVLAGKWPGAHVLAMTTLAAAYTHHAKAQALMARLEQTAIQRGGLTRWEGRKDCWNSYAGGDVVPTAMALKALCLLKPLSQLIPSGEAFLATEFRGYGWYSTWSTSQVVGLIPALAKVRHLNWGKSEIRARVEGGPSWDFAGADRLAFRRWGNRDPRPGFLGMPEPRPVSLEASGKGVLVWTYAYQVPGSAAPAPKGESSGALRLGLERKLWRLRTPQETGNPSHGWVRQPWTGSLRQGEEAWMELDLRVDQSAEYVMLEVPIPAGLEPTVKLEGFVLEGRPFSEADATDESYRWSKPRIEVHPDKVTFLFPRLSPWISPVVRIWMRAGMAGHYRLRPAKLSLMSNETQWTTCDGLDLDVLERGN
nr:MG2 domain-containing protein [uncultured Holophaga sp.]